MQLQDTTGMDRAQWYETRRNELLKLLERTKVLEIPEKEATELAAIRKKCLENQFEIVLVAEFQGGKSTTFNALCDGRDLSPRGLGGGGIKTSAAIISAQNISDGETKNGMDEWAEITFKSKYEIQYGMFDILHDGGLAENESFHASIIKSGVKQDDYSFKVSNAEEFAKTLDLDNPVHKQAIRKTLNNWWTQWNSDKASLSNDELDRLRIATLTEHFYGTPEYKELITKTIAGIYDFQSLIAFPIDWNTRWSNGQNASFKLSEVAFIFIARTLLRIKSENLARLGCRITDCPGLFANSFDTEVAKKAITLSDAVWYLVGGAKQIGQQELESLKLIKGMGMASKIVGSVNFRGKHKNIEANIFPATKSVLETNGFNFPLLPYDARLAFLANQGERLEQHKGLSDNDLYGMKIDSENIDTSLLPAPEEMWTSMINDAGVITGVKNLKSVDDVSEESVALVREVSNIDEVMAFLNKDIISKKSHAILIDNGSKKAADALQEYEGKLKISEDAALQDEETWKKNVEESEAALEKFVNDSGEILEDSTFVLEKNKLSQDLAEDLINQAIDDNFIEEIAFMIALSLLDHRGFYWSAEDLTDEIIKDVSPKLNPLFNDCMTRVLSSWIDETGYSDSWHSYTKRLSRVGKDIKKLWSKDIGTNRYLKNVPWKMPSSTEVEAQLKEIRDTVFKNEQIKEFITQVHRGILRELAATILLFIPALIVYGIKRLFFPEEKEPTKEELKRKRESYARKQARTQIVPKIKDQLRSKDFQKKISKNFDSSFLEMQNKAKEGIESSLENLLVRFEKEHVDPATRNFSESETKRKEIAEKNHKIRVEQIEPLRREIREFEAQVSNEINA